MKKRREEWTTNRDLTLQPRRCLVWCRCDKNQEAPGKKCKICGRRILRRRLRK